MCTTHTRVYVIGRIPCTREPPIRHSFPARLAPCAFFCPHLGSGPLPCPVIDPPWDLDGEKILTTAREACDEMVVGEVCAGASCRPRGGWEVPQTATRGCVSRNGCTHGHVHICTAMVLRWCGGCWCGMLCPPDDMRSNRTKGRKVS